jgi:hypothetical protein
MDDRPRGVTVLGVMAMLGGFLHLIPSTLALVAGVLGIFSGMFTTTGQAGAPASETGLILAGLGLIGVMAALVLIVAGFGVLQVRSWAWSLAVIAAIITMVGAAARLIIVAASGPTADPLGRLFAPLGEDISIASETLALVLCGIALVYLWTPTVRAAFGRYTDATAPL